MRQSLAAQPVRAQPRLNPIAGCHLRLSVLGACGGKTPAADTHAQQKCTHERERVRAQTSLWKRWKICVKQRAEVRRRVHALSLEVVTRRKRRTASPHSFVQSRAFSTTLFSSFLHHIHPHKVPIHPSRIVVNPQTCPSPRRSPWSSSRSTTPTRTSGSSSTARVRCPETISSTASTAITAIFEHV